MRNGQKRMRGRGHRKSQNPLARVFESNGPDVKIRGTASHIAEKYIQLARDAQSSGDPVAAENYYQHAEHYFRLIAAAQEQFRQQNPYYNQQPQPSGNVPQGGDDGYDEEGEEGQPFAAAGEQPQPYLPRDAQPFPPRDQQQNARPAQQPNQPQPAGDGGQNVGGLPAFITGGQPQPNVGGNGHDQGEQRGQDRYGGGYRRRRRRGGYRSDRPDLAGGSPQSEGSEPQPSE
jgi:hypothetical protein